MPAIVPLRYLNDVQILDVETLQWQYVAPFPLFIAPRSLHSVVACAAGGELWTYGGRNSAVAALPEWNVLHLPQAAAATTATTAAPKKGTKTASSAIAPSASAPAEPAAAAAPMLDEGSAGSGSIMDAFLNQ